MSVVCEADFIEWQRHACARHRVDRMVICEKPKIIAATYFLGHDDEPSGPRPLPRQTSISGSPLDGRHWRFPTAGEAKIGHWRAVDLLREAMEQGLSA